MQPHSFIFDRNGQVVLTVPVTQYSLCDISLEILDGSFLGALLHRRFFVVIADALSMNERVRFMNNYAECLIMF